MRTYSPFFQTLHDETAPVGSLGRGTHYSVCRATVFHDEHGKQLKEAMLLDFAVIWDEDHDERAFVPIERLYRSGDLPSFIMFGERKAMFFGFLSPKLEPRPLHIPDIAVAEQALQRSSEYVHGDNWSHHLSWRGAPNGIISDDEDKVLLYINTINMLWKLGLKDIVEPEPPEPDI